MGVSYLKTATEGQLLAACEDVMDLKRLLDLLKHERLSPEAQTFVGEIMVKRQRPPER